MNLILLGLATAYFLVIIDISGTAVLLPAMQHSLTLSMNQMQWVLNIYTVAMACMLVPIGKMADRYGLKRVFLGGIIVFIGGSVLCATATNFTVELVGRAIQGIGGATIFPVGLAIIPRIVEEERVSYYMGLLVAINATVYAVSGLVAGLIVQYFHWRIFFYVNIPFGLIALFVLGRKLPSIDIIEKNRLDLWGILFSSLFVLGVVFALMQSQLHGWSDPIIIAAFATGIFCFIVFVLVEIYTKNPLVQLSFFKKIHFDGIVLSLAIWQGLILGVAFVLIFLQSNWKFTPSEAGYLTLAIGIPSGICSRFNNAIVNRFSLRKIILLGYAMMVLSYACWAIGVNYNYYIVIVGAILFGMGAPLAFINSTTKGMLSFSKQYHGVISGILYAFRYVGGSILFAVLGSIINADGGQLGKHVIRLPLITQAFYVAAALGVVAFLLIYGSVSKTQSNVNATSR